MGNFWFSHWDFVMPQFCLSQKSPVSTTSLVCKLGQLKTGGGNLWNYRQSAIETVCSQNNRMFLLLMRLGLQIFPWNDMKRDMRPCCSSAEEGLPLR